MAYEKINQPIVDAVDILIDKKLQEAGYDKTVSATIVQCISPLTGKHLIQRTEGQKEVAYSQNGIIYNAGDQVYITIPSNDSTMDKQILGMQRHEATFAAKSQLSIDKRFNKVNTYIFESSGNNEWNLNKDIEIPDDRTILQNASFILRFNLEIKPVDKYNPDALKDINYSFALQDEDENNPPLDTLSIDEIKGNPYYTDEPVEQVKVFNNSELAKCKKIKIIGNGIDNLTFTIDSMEFIVAQDLLDPEIEDYWTIHKEDCSIEGNIYEKYWIQYYDKGKQITDTVFCYWAMKNSNVTKDKKDNARYSSYTEEGWELKQRTTASIDGSEDYFLVEKGQLPYYSNEFKCVIVEVATQVGKYPFVVNNPNRAEKYTVTITVDNEDPSSFIATLNQEFELQNEESIIFSWTSLDSFGNEIEYDQSDVISLLNEPRLLRNIITIKDSMPMVLNLTCKVEYQKTNGDKFLLAENSYSSIGQGSYLLISNANQVFLYNGDYVGGDPLPLTAQLWREGKSVTEGWKLKVSESSGLVTSIKPDDKSVTFTVAKTYNMSQVTNSQITLSAVDSNDENNIIASTTTSFAFMQSGDPGTNGTEYVAQIIKDDKICNFISSFDTSYGIKLTNIRTGDSLSFTENIIHNTIDNKIAQIECVYNEITYYAYASITSLVIDQNSGFNFILYGSNGKNPRCGLQHFAQTNGTILEPTGITASDGKEYLKYNNSNFSLTNTSLTTSSPKYIEIEFKINGVESSIPILLLKNRYEYASINGWDGQGVDIGDDYVLSPMAGFGKKNDDNSFTGVVLGEGSNGDLGLMAYTKQNYGFIEKNGKKYLLTEEEVTNGIYRYYYYDENNKRQFGKDTGIYSLTKNDGRTVYIDANTGTAYFGASGSGQIIIDGTQAVIESGGYRAPLENPNYSQSGTKIDFANGDIYSQNFSIINGSAYFRGDISGSSGTFGNVTINSNGIDSTYFKINSKGEATFTKGNIAGFIVEEERLYKINDSDPLKEVGLSATGEYAFWAGQSNDGHGNTSSFKVTHEGALYSTDGEIGGFKISDILSTNNKTSIDSGEGVYLGSEGIGLGNNFKVTKDGSGRLGKIQFGLLWPGEQSTVNYTSIFYDSENSGYFNINQAGKGYCLSEDGLQIKATDNYNGYPTQYSYNETFSNGQGVVLFERIWCQYTEDGKSFRDHYTSINAGNVILTDNFGGKVQITSKNISINGKFVLLKGENKIQISNKSSPGLLCLKPLNSNTDDWAKYYCVLYSAAGITNYSEVEIQ